MAGKGNTAKLHYYVPQAYLRGFANDKGRITVVPFDDSRKTFVSSVKNVAAQSHFYTIDGLSEPDEFEKALSRIEHDATLILRDFETGMFPPSEADRQTLSFYMALQCVRGPDTRKTMDYIHAKQIRVEVGAGGRRNVASWIKKNFGLDPTPEQENCSWEAATQPGGPPIVFSNQTHIEHMVETAEELTSYMECRPWILVQFDRRSLITSDAPISMIPNPDHEQWQGVGFATAWGITFPISRKLGLLMCDPGVLLSGLTPQNPRVQETRTAILRGTYDQQQPGTTAMEKLFNERSVGSASEYVYHHPDDAQFVPDNLPEPNLVKMSVNGFTDAEYDGEPWFGQQED